MPVAGFADAILQMFFALASCQILFSNRISASYSTRDRSGPSFSRRWVQRQQRFQTEVGPTPMRLRLRVFSRYRPRPLMVVVFFTIAALIVLANFVRVAASPEKVVYGWPLIWHWHTIAVAPAFVFVCGWEHRRSRSQSRGAPLEGRQAPSFDDWLCEERELRERSLSQGRRHWKKHRSKAASILVGNVWNSARGD